MKVKIGVLSGRSGNLSVSMPRPTRAFPVPFFHVRQKVRLSERVEEGYKRLLFTKSLSSRGKSLRTIGNSSMVPRYPIFFSSIVYYSFQYPVFIYRFTFIY